MSRFPHPAAQALRSLIVFLLFLGAPALYAERLPIKVYTSADGLGSSAAFNLVHDSRGFIWLCSRDGLVRFDGYRFITYRIGNEAADPAVYSMLPTRNGVYWINLNTGTDYRFTDQGDATPLAPIPQQVSKNDTRIPLVNVEPVQDRFPNFEDSGGNLWAADEKGLVLLQETNGRMAPRLIEFQLPGNPEGVLTREVFANGSAGSFWIGTNWGLVRHLTNGTLIHYNIQPQDGKDLVTVFAEDKENRIWIARPEGILVLKVEPVAELVGPGNFSSRKIIIKPGKVDADGLAQLPVTPGVAFAFSFRDLLRRDVNIRTGSRATTPPEIFGMVTGADGAVWMAATGGLVVYDGRRFQHFTEQQGLASNDVSQIVEDGAGNIWLNGYAGLMRLNPKGFVTYDLDDGLVERRVHSIYESARGELYVVTDNWNISSWQNGRFSTARPPVPADSSFLWHSNVALLDSHDDWWVITNKKLYRYSGISKVEELTSRQPVAVYTDQNGLISNQTSNVWEDSHGDIWISNDPSSKQIGLVRWHRATGSFEHFFAPDGLIPNAYVSAFAEDKAGTLWFGFGEGGLTRYRDGRFEPIDVASGAPAGSITNLFVDSKGRLWIASSITGLSRLDDPTAAHPSFRRYTIADGLTSNNIRCITEDLFGNIYLGTVRGVNRLSPETGHVKYYGTGDGLAGDFISAAHRDHSGAIWFGTFSGLSKITPEPDVITPPPATLISGLRIAGIDYSISPLGQTEVNVPEQSASNNNLQIDFFSISSPGMRYQYRLEGADKDWSPPTDQRTVTFANVRPGRYRFLVRSVNGDDIAFDKPAAITFRILPPIWQRWWFLTLAALFVVGGVVALDRYRVARARELSSSLSVSQTLALELTKKGDELGRAHRALALDYDVTRILAESATPGEAAPRILKAICETTGWDVGALWYVGDDASGLRCAEAWYPLEIAAQEFETLSRESIFPSGMGLPGRVWETGEPAWINELEKDRNFPRIEAATRVGLKSAFAFPILLGSEVIGVGEFFSRELRARDDEMLAMLGGIGSDIGQLIERKQQEEALRESEDRFRTLAETASDAIITIDEGGLIVFVNPAVEKVFGYAPAQLTGQDLTMLMPEYLRHLHSAGFKRYQETGQKHISWEAVELPGLHQSGREIPLELSFGEFVRNERRYFTGIVRDVTDRKQAAEALQRSREERLGELERVRRRIATDLHDDIGSSLTQISIMSEVVQNRGGGDNGQALAMIANSSRELVDAMGDIVWAINPQKDHLSDLRQRMRRFAADVLTSRGIELEFRAPADGDDIALGANIRREVFLVFKETINNMVKHSGLTRAEIDFRIAEGQLTLRVSDNGSGFDTSRDSEGHGLMSMRERSGALGGAFAVTSKVNQGTIITLRVPLDSHFNGK